MASANEQSVRRFHDAYNARDRAACAALVSEDFELHSALVDVQGGVYRAADGLDSYFDDLAAAWQEFQLELEELREVDDEHVLAFTRVHGRSASGVRLDPHIAAVFELRDGRIRRIRAFMDREEALEAAGPR